MFIIVIAMKIKIKKFDPTTIKKDAVVLLIGKRGSGVLIANCNGTARGFALFNLQERGRLFIDPQTACYEGMIVGIHSRDNDLVVNVTKEKQLTNMRASGTDENIVLTPAIKYSLEQALEFIDDDELVEVTPQSIRLRKKDLNEQSRKRTARVANSDDNP